MNTVRLPDDEDREKLDFLIENGDAIDLETLVADILGYAPEGIVVLAIKIAMEESLQSGDSIDVNYLVNEYKEWQDSMT